MVVGQEKKYGDGLWDERQKTLKVEDRCKPDGKPVSEYHLMGTWGSNLLLGGGNYRFGGDVTQTIRFLIDTIGTPQS